MAVSLCRQFEPLLSRRPPSPKLRLILAVGELALPTVSALFNNQVNKLSWSMSRACMPLRGWIVVWKSNFPQRHLFWTKLSNFHHGKLRNVTTRNKFHILTFKTMIFKSSNQSSLLHQPSPQPRLQSPVLSKTKSLLHPNTQITIYKSTNLAFNIEVMILPSQ